MKYTFVDTLPKHASKNDLPGQIEGVLYKLAAVLNRKYLEIPIKPTSGSGVLTWAVLRRGLLITHTLVT